MSPSLYRPSRRLSKQSIPFQPQRKRKYLRYVLIDVSPDTGLYSKLEWAILNALEALAIVYQPQVPEWGGVGILGGVKWDFVLPDYRTIVRGQGYWHSLSGASSRDFLAEVRARAEGWRIVDVNERDIPRMREALQEQLGIPLGVS